MKKSILVFGLFAFLVTKSNSQTVTDYDGNIYNTVTIGTQVWLKENLKVTHYRTGDSIPNVVDNSSWNKLNSGAYSYQNNKSSYNSIYGKLYNFYSLIDSSQICPAGWHVPSLDEWRILWNKLGDSAGGKLKERGSSHWYCNVGATDKYGFTALPGGDRKADGSFSPDDDVTGSWWTSTALPDLNEAYFLYISWCSPILCYSNTSIKCGFYVRCLSDYSSQINDNKREKEINIYPNPAYDKIFIDCINGQNLKMQLYNSIGECVLQKVLKNQTNTINISSLTKGIYILTITSSNGTIEKKLLKE